MAAPYRKVQHSLTCNLLMKTILFTTFAALVLGSTSATGQSACLPSDLGMSQRISATSRLLASSDSSDIRAVQHKQLSAVRDSSVQAVTTDSICAAARDSYNAALPSAVQQAGRRVYVIRVGNRYLVEDPTVMFGEFGMVMVLDDSFAVLGMFTS
jgi:hypothetical protein